ncbi:MAG TPA: NADPH:quinone reductase [Verrucomicrobiales bacterium]|nr:NADPH:quinone reductase [Verrucomicrobiales bacterium]
MKAIRVHQFGGPEVLRLEELPVPRPAAGQVRVRVHAIGVNPVDTYLRGGANPSLTLPFTPGLDAAGVVEEVGPSTAGFGIGMRVYVGGCLTGAYAEQLVARAAQVYRLPDQTSFAQGASLHVPYATAHRALFHRAQARAGESLLVHGASGGVGLAAIQFARAAGLLVIGTAGTPRGRELALEAGAHHVLDHTSPGYLGSLGQLTAGRGVDILLEMLANVNLGNDLPTLARGGRVIVIGSRGKVELTPRDLMTREADIRGMSLFNAGEEELRSIHAAIHAGLENQTLRPIIAREMPLAEAAQAHTLILQPGAQGKIILTA